MLLLSVRPVSASVWDSLLPVDHNTLNFSHQGFAACFPSVCPKSQYSQGVFNYLFYLFYVYFYSAGILFFVFFFFPLPMLYLELELTSLIAHLIKNLPAMQETWVRSLGWEDPLEKEMATHSTILAWRVPWTEESGGLLSMGSQESDMLSDQTTTTRISY